MKRILAFSTLLFSVAALTGEPLEFTWPTPNDAYAAGKGPDGYLLRREAGNIDSGDFGCTVNHGMLFHGGLDLKPLQRDWMDEPTDPVRSVMPGIVRYINRDQFNSQWGLYIVVEHFDLEPKLVSVYSHLRKIPFDLSVNQQVEEGQVIGTLGHSSKSESISKAQAFLHFQVALRLSDTFPDWYGRQDASESNKNGVWHPRNLLAIDFLDLAAKLKMGEQDNVKDYILMQPIAVSLKVQALKSPDFIRRYPELIGEALNKGKGGHGWQINFNAYGLPTAWRTLSKDEVVGMGPNVTEVVYHDPQELDRYPCHELVEANWQGEVVAGPRLLELIGILFNL